MLGGNSGVSGKYELGIDHIRIVNEEDVTDEPLEKVLESELLCVLFAHPTW